jgi:hypothetical protein
MEHWDIPYTVGSRDALTYIHTLVNSRCSTTMGEERSNSALLTEAYNSPLRACCGAAKRER